MDEPIFTSSVHYRDPKAALAWLERAFGFEITMAIDGPPEAPEMCHYEMSHAPGRAGSWSAPSGPSGSAARRASAAPTPSRPRAAAGGLDEHCERARAAGASIAAEPEDQFYGDRIYSAARPRGHRWTFSSTCRDVTRAEAEAALGQPITATQWA